MLFFDSASGSEVVPWEILVDEDGATGSWLLLAREEVLNLEGCEFIIPAYKERFVGSGGEDHGGI